VHFRVGEGTGPSGHKGATRLIRWRAQGGPLMVSRLHAAHEEKLLQGALQSVQNAPLSAPNKAVILGFYIGKKKID